MVMRKKKQPMEDTQKLFDQLKMSEDKKVLVVGNEQLVKVCRKNEVEAYGCEMKNKSKPQSKSKDNIYPVGLHDVHFPTDHFDHVICLDVLVDRPNDLQEIFRIVDQECEVVVRVPDQCENMLKKVGFEEIEPIEKDNTSVLLSAKKPMQDRIKLLVPPGIGDIYWTLIKTEAFLKRERIAPPVDTYVAAPRTKKYKAEERSYDFLEMFPFLHSAREMRFNQRNSIWKEAYHEQGRPIFKNVMGCDYFITWNGYLRAGKSLEEVDPDLTCNWFLPRFVSLNEENYRKSCIDKYGDYLALYWTFMGVNTFTFRHFSLEDIAYSCNKIIDKTGLCPILIGAIWDKDDEHTDKLKSMLPRETVDLRSKTSIEEVFGLMRGSKAVVGLNSGITIMSAVLGVKTVILYHNYFTTNGVHRDFAWNTFPPTIRRQTYFAEYAEEIMPDGFADRAISVIKDEVYVEEQKNIRPLESRVNYNKMPAARRHAAPMASSVRMFDKNRLKEQTDKNEKTVVVCLFSSTDDRFTDDHVRRLKGAIANNVTLPYEFVCVTDKKIDQQVGKQIVLDDEYCRWSPKLELFKPGFLPNRHIVYFDLDVEICSNIDDLIKSRWDFMALRPWHPSNYKKKKLVTTIISWINDGSFSFIYERSKNNSFHGCAGDSEYISRLLVDRDIEPIQMQNEILGINTYRNIRRGNVRGTPRIICYNGHKKDI